MTHRALNTMSDDQRYAWVRLEPFFGHVHLESRLRPEGNRLIGEGRARHFDKDDRLVKDTGWKPTGIVVTIPATEPRRWWEFWKCA